MKYNELMRRGDFINKIFATDCIEGMDSLPKKSVDIVVTSPPYNIGVKYNDYSDNRSHSEYLDWMGRVAAAAKRILRDDGSFFLNVGDRPSDEFRAFEVALEFAKSFRLQNTIHWIKSFAAPERGVSIGHYKPVNSDRFLSGCHEYIFHFTKNMDVRMAKVNIGVPYGDKSNIGRYSDVDLRDRGNTWFIPYETVQEAKLHPASFPALLPTMCIKFHGYKKTTVVLDPFMGSGTTAIAAQELGCGYIGFELDPYYVSIAEKRLKTAPLLMRI